MRADAVDRATTVARYADVSGCAGLVDARVDNTGARRAHTHASTRRNANVPGGTGLIYSGIDYACTRCATTRGRHTPLGHAHRLAINNRVGGRHDKQPSQHCNRK